MNPKSPLLAGFLVVACILPAGCGGETTGTTQTAGGGSSGAPAGGASTGGGATGGMTGGSGAFGGGAAGAGGSSLPSRCLPNADPGNCTAHFESYYHDVATGVCTPFIYGGCDGNENRFDSIAECQANCSGGSPDLDTCEQPTDCTVVSPSCCGDCEPARFQRVTSINALETDRYRTLRNCGDVACEPCMAVRVSDRAAPYFVATCDRGHCIPIDLRDSPVTACSTDSDCFLRAGAGCCEACDTSEIIAISDANALSGLVCGDAPVTCPGCAVMLPPNLVAVCDGGTCAVREVGP